MLGILASIALVVGGVQTAMVMSEEDRLAAEENQPTVEPIRPRHRRYCHFPSSGGRGLLDLCFQC